MRTPQISMIATMLMAGIGIAWAQQPIYLCNGTYTDRPCANGKEIDIQPTEGMHSLSGQKRQSHEAMMRDISRQVDASQKRGLDLVITTQRCDLLRQQRLQLDRTDKAGSLTDRRFAIRQEQFKLGCKQN